MCFSRGPVHVKSDRADVEPYYVHSLLVSSAFHIVFSPLKYSLFPTKVLSGMSYLEHDISRITIAWLTGIARFIENLVASRSKWFSLSSGYKYVHNWLQKLLKKFLDVGGWSINCIHKGNKVHKYVLILKHKHWLSVIIIKMWDILTFQLATTYCSI